MDKKKVKQNLNRLRRIKTWQLAIIFVLACFVSATFLRLNNIGMVYLREAVESADEKGDSSATQDRLYDLQRYVSSHMNTSMGKGVYLEASYKRDVQNTLTKAAGGSNGNIHKKAQEICAPRYKTWSTAYVQCTVSELAKFPAAEPLVLPRPDMYLHSYVSPLWSPDFAGWSVLICVVILIIIIARITSVVILRMMLRRRYKSI